MILTTWERIVLNNVVAEQKGGMAVIRLCMQLFDKLEFKEAEKAEIELLANAAGLQWRETGRQWDVDLSATQIATLKTWLEAREWAAFEARLVVALCGKFGINE